MKRMAIIMIGIGLIIIGSIIMFKDTFGSTIEKTSEIIAINAVSSKINASLKNGFYDENLNEALIYAERDKDGSIKYLEPNTWLINKLLLAFSTNVKENYSLTDIQEIPVNLGVLTGNKLISQLPITVNIRVHPVSLTKFQYETDFETEGINQTRYYVYCRVTSKIHILAPFTDKVATIDKKILLAEAIIVGKVPENYVMVPEDSILDAIE
ncbi:MAG: sporulation protein YunB [Firmicutes bacterium]|nr:sporulation protein YunB [Bacillota bacterium]